MKVTVMVIGFLTNKKVTVIHEWAKLDQLMFGIT
jgi:hypothetical protein